MRRMWAAGAAIVVCLALGAPVMAQETSPSATPMTSTGTADVTGIVDCQVSPCELPITSTFDSDDEGWTAVGDADSTTPEYRPSGGDPGGFVQTTDQVVGGVWYWVAPSKFSGDLEHAYGRRLTFDLKQSRLDTQFDDVDVYLEGGGESLTMKFGLPPGSTWTGYAVPLDVTGGWIVGTSTPATEQQIRAVLGDLDGLRIRGEYRTGADTGGLDNVAFGVPGALP